jgi:hypothetical protein
MLVAYCAFEFCERITADTPIGIAYRVRRMHSFRLCLTHEHEQQQSCLRCNRLDL